MSFAYLPSFALLAYSWSVDVDPWSVGTSSSDFIEDQICHQGTKVCRSRGKVQGQLVVLFYWCRIHIWFRLMGGLQTKSMTSQRYRATHKMADMRYYGNVMTTTRWRLYVTMETLWQQQDGGYALLWKRYIDWTCYRCILHLQRYSRRLNLFVYFFCVEIIRYRRVKLWSSFGFLHHVLGLLQCFRGTYCLHLQGDQIWFSLILKWLKDWATNQPTSQKLTIN